MQLMGTLLAEVMVLLSLGQTPDENRSLGSKTLDSNQEIDCSDHIEMSGIYHVGERGYFERSECEEAFALRFAEREMQREFGRRWSEAYVNGVWTIDLKVRGYIAREHDRFSRRIYVVEDVIYANASNEDGGR